MIAVSVFLRAELRQRWRSWVALALLAGMFCGTVGAVAAGARRTDSAYPDLLAWSDAPDVLIYSPSSSSPTFARLPLAALARLPQTAQSATLADFSVVAPGTVVLVAPENNGVPGSLWRRKILAGRLVDPARPDQVDISFTLAQSSHLKVGGTLRTVLLTNSGKPRPFDFRIAGIDAAPAEFPPQSGTGTDFVWATPAFYLQYHARIQTSAGVALRLRRGAADLPAVQDAVSRLGHGKIAESYPLAAQTVNTEHSIHLQAVALWLVAGLLAVIALLVLGQLLARMSFLESAQYATLRALGMSRRQLLAAGLARAAAIGAAGSAAGVLLAVALSPVFPLGLARIAEPHPGISADPIVLGLGSAAVVLATVGCAALPAWQAASRSSDAAPVSPGRPRQSMISVATASLNPVTAMMGVRLALQPGSGRTALPVRSTITGAAVGVAALSAAMVFSASLAHLLATPRLYGVTWDASVSSLQQSGVGPAERSIARDSGAAAWSAGYSGAPMVVRGVRADAIAMNPGHGGPLMPVLIAGRLPRRADEITLGARTLAAIHSHLGATVRVSLGGPHPARVTIVGVAVFPTFSDALSLGQGAALTVGGLRALLPPGVHAPPFDTLLVRFRAGPGLQASTRALASRMARLGPFVVQGPAAPTDLVNFGRVQDMPLLLGISLSALALLTIAHLLLTSVRRRRRDLAVLRVIGFTRGQVRAAVGWQAGTLACAALIIGIPLGVLCGRVAWRTFAHQLGIPPVIDVPHLLAVIAPVAIALAVALAALPGESAARARPAEILRSE
jgi:hypothetical protein